MPWEPIEPLDSQQAVGQEPGPMSGPGYWRGHKLANWGQRAAATGIDVFLASMAAWAISFSGYPEFAFVYFIGAWAMAAHGIDNQGTSPGKHLMKLTVVVPRIDPNTRAVYACYPQLRTLSLRFIGHIVDTLPFYLGWLRPAWNERRQTWADGMTHTLVFHKWPHDEFELVKDFPGLPDA
jgi:uncharacterized RDD family membrane protein YckC